MKFGLKKIRTRFLLWELKHRVEQLEFDMWHGFISYEKYIKYMKIAKKRENKLRNAL